MADEDIPYIDGVRVLLDDTASAALMVFATGSESVKLTLSQDVLMLLIGRLRDLNAEWETRRRQIDPGAGKAGDVTAMTAIRAFSVRTASIAGGNEAAIIFDTQSGPQAFALPKSTIAEVAMMLLREAERSPGKPPLSS